MHVVVLVYLAVSAGRGAHMRFCLLGSLLSLSIVPVVGVLKGHANVCGICLT